MSRGDLLPLRCDSIVIWDIGKSISLHECGKYASVKVTSKKAFLIILGLSIVITWLTKEIGGVLNFSLGGLKAGLPLNYYQCSFISSCNTYYLQLVVDIIFWFLVIFIAWKLLGKITQK